MILIYLVTFDTLRVMFTVDRGSDLHTGLIVFLLWGTCAGLTVCPGVMQCGAAPPLCRRRPYLTDPRRSPGALPAALVPTLFRVPNEHRCAALY